MFEGIHRRKSFRGYYKQQIFREHSEKHNRVVLDPIQNTVVLYVHVLYLDQDNPNRLLIVMDLLYSFYPFVTILREAECFDALAYLINRTKYTDI